MRHGLYLLAVLIGLSLIPGCTRMGATATSPPTGRPQATERGESAATPDAVTTPSSPGCPQPDGEGTVSPNISIVSIVFVVNGVEQVVQDGDTLQALPGDQVQMKEATICTGSFSGDGGEACVDLAPVDSDGREVRAEHGGTHLRRVTPGFVSTPGPDRVWIIDENWARFSAVLNHWAPESTADLACAEGRCERDDWMMVPLPPS